ncbi:cobalt-zinc-cadmium resistance protein CzcA [Abditibacterium utsteinense]|uniref:Cobalt-zinc-cadmium resistance protein CzcA n=1 Tax=Abditibacterium utsteinense TaxID=1960156 RepID=A0A2S8SPG3_9BACT|nr:CusA/CzcA family heavy metal efflux RND transporter [Abditibacterium utsteinense]PQV62687.1 cobalt-zinc-cadmium resistance protein CzcA [Abditibacterium utsteinense]
MLNQLIRFSIQQRFFVMIFAILLLGVGIYNATLLPIDAVPDVTNKQVQINTLLPGLAPPEMEQQVTFPLEVALAGMPRLKETRSISQFGLSQITVIFEDNVDIYFARSLVFERLQNAQSELPEGAKPEMGPVSTGLGEIYYLFLQGPGTLEDRRTMMDFVVKPQLRTVQGLSEVNTWGGQAKQYQVVVDPQKLAARGLHVRDVSSALQNNNRNAGGGYLNRGDEQQLVRGVGQIQTMRDIETIVLKAENGIPILVRDVAKVQTGGMPRQGAVTLDGKGEAVAAITMLLLGENGRVVVDRVKDKVVAIQKTLPEGTQLVGFLDRGDLIRRTLATAIQNLVEGGVLVVVVLFLFLLQVRAGLIVSATIPLAMLIAIIGMRYFGVSANLMSLGAIDFGLIVDGAVIIVENCIRRLVERREHLARDLTEPERLETIYESTQEMVKPSIFGIGIIIAAYLPILTLQGIEGKMFRPMGMTVIMALLGAMLLSITLTPALCAFFLKIRREKHNIVLDRVSRGYEPALRWTLKHRGATALGALLFFGFCASLFGRLGSEFIPQLDEGSSAIQVFYPTSMSIEKAVERAGVFEQVLMKNFPDEIDQVFTRIGRPEVATDPMFPSQHDAIVTFKPRDGWKKADSNEELVEKITEVAAEMPGLGTSFTQPVRMRMNELVEGVGIRSELGIKLYGDDLQVLSDKANEIARVVRTVPGNADVGVEATEGLPMLNIDIRREAIARHGINVSDVQEVIEAAIGGSNTGTIVRGNAKFALVVRLEERFRRDPEAIGRITVPDSGGSPVPLAQLASIQSVEGPIQISRENGSRRVVIQSNVKGRDLGGFVEQVKREVAAQVKLPVGYRVEYGGTYEHLSSGRARLMIVVPLTFALIFLLLFTTFGSLKQAALVFTGIPFAITGGILALLFRGLPFSISAGIGFIALFGVAVLNGVVLVSFINELRASGKTVFDATLQGSMTRLRPVLMTATVAGIGFIPMALGHGAGAEVQKPLASVVIGGLITSTLLTLFVLPTLYNWFERDAPTGNNRAEVEV